MSDPFKLEFETTLHELTTSYWNGWSRGDYPGKAIRERRVRLSSVLGEVHLTQTFADDENPFVGPAGEKKLFKVTVEEIPWPTQA